MIFFIEHSMLVRVFLYFARDALGFQRSPSRFIKSSCVPMDPGKYNAMNRSQLLIPSIHMGHDDIVLHQYVFFARIQNALVLGFQGTKCACFWPLPYLK